MFSEFTIKNTILSTLSIVNEEKNILLKYLSFSFLLTFIASNGLSIYQQFSPTESFSGFISTSILTLILESYFYICTAVLIHRIMLSESSSISFLDCFLWKTRHFNFLISTIIFYVIMFLIGLITAPILGIMMAFFVSEPELLESKLFQIQLSLFALIFHIPTLYIATRIILIFPAAALNKSISIGESFKITEKHDFKLMLLATLLPAILIYLRDNEYLVSSEIYIDFLISIFKFFVVFIEISILSVCYKLIIQNAPTENT